MKNDASNVKNTNYNIKKSLTVVACMLIQLCAGLLYLWSAFNKRVQLDYSFSADSAKMVGSYMVLAFVAGNLIGGILQDKTNPRLCAIIGSIMFCLGVILTSLLTSGTIKLIYLTYSTLSGVGCGIIYASALACIQRWFPHKRGFASGLAVASFAFATVVFTPIIESLLKYNSVSFTFKALGIAFLIIAGIACVFISLPQNTQKKSELTGLSPKQAVKKTSFWCIALTCFFANATWNILMPDITLLGLNRGLTSNMATVTLMLVGIFNVLGRFSIASISDKIGREKSIVITSALTFCCAITLIWAKSYVYIIAVAFTAFGYGGPSATMPAMCADSFGIRCNGTNYGIALLGLGLSSVVFKSFSNALENTRLVTGGFVNEFTLSFLLAALTALIPIFLMWVYFKARQKQCDKVRTCIDE